MSPPGGCATALSGREAQRKDLRVGRESVVLSAGSIKSPQLLMLSGIGAETELASHGITCRVNLPGGTSSSICMCSSRVA